MRSGAIDIHGTVVGRDVDLAVGDDGQIEFVMAKNDVPLVAAPQQAQACPRQRLTEQLARAGFADVNFVDATTILKDDREFGVFLCTATKVREPIGDH